MNRRQFAAVVIGATLIGLPGARVYANTQLESDPQPHTSDIATPSATPPDATDVDIRDVFARPWKYQDTAIRFAGIVHEMRVAPPGQGYPTGDEDTGTSIFRTQMLVEVAFPQGSLERVLVVSDIDPDDVHRGVYVEIVAVHGGNHREEDSGGGFWEWPLFIAISIEPVPEPEQP
jgi:hypothetical protein